jgi:hypothetical protein
LSRRWTRGASSWMCRAALGLNQNVECSANSRQSSHSVIHTARSHFQLYDLCGLWFGLKSEFWGTHNRFSGLEKKKSSCIH